MPQLWPQTGVSVYKTNGKKMIMITITMAIPVKITIMIMVMIMATDYS